MVWVYIEDIDRLTIIAIIISMIILRQQLPEKKTSKCNIYNMSESKVSVFCLTLKHICLFPFQGWKLPYIEPILSLY